jgi:hypothetical protein
MGQASSPVLILLAFGFFFATYNLVTMTMHNRSIGKWVYDDSDGEAFFDPVIEMPEEVKKPKNARMPFHVALTATDAPYSKWQCRIMYYWYKKNRDLSGSEMGGFTRILHSGKPDNLMDEMPTVVVDPLPAGLDRVSFLRFFFLIVERACIPCYWLRLASFMVYHLVVENLTSLQCII